jgi:hypothetical protein
MVRQLQVTVRNYGTSELGYSVTKKFPRDAETTRVYGRGGGGFHNERVGLGQEVKCPRL